MSFFDKSQVMQDEIDRSSMMFFGRKTSDCLLRGTCLMCGEPALPCLTRENLVEYQISALCTNCQTVVFNDSYDSEYDG